MDTALPQKFPFILDRNLPKANCTENRVCTSCDTVVLGFAQFRNSPSLGKISFFKLNFSNFFKKKFLISLNLIFTKFL